MMGLITNLTTILMVSWEIYFQHRHAYDPNSERSLMNTAAVTFFILVQLVSHVMSWTIIYLYIAEWTFLCLGFNILVTWLATKRAMANDSNDDKIKNKSEYQPKNKKFDYSAAILSSWISPCSIYYMAECCFKQDEKFQQHDEQLKDQQHEQQKSEQKDIQPQEKPLLLVHQQQEEVTNLKKTQQVSKKLMFIIINSSTIIQLLVVSVIALILSSSNVLQTSKGGPIIHCTENTWSPNVKNQSFSWIKVCWSASEECQSNVRFCEVGELSTDLVLNTVIPKIIIFIFLSGVSSFALQLMGN